MSFPESDPPRLDRRGTRIVYAFSIWMAIIALAVLPLSAGTKIVHRWIVTSEPIPKVRKVLVAAILENYLIRQEFEDEMERLLAQSGVQGIKSHMVLPPRNEMMEGEWKQRIKESHLDAVLVIRPNGCEQRQRRLQRSATTFRR
jgi:hypothetical protein